MTDGEWMQERSGPYHVNETGESFTTRQALFDVLDAMDDERRWSVTVTAPAMAGDRTDPGGYVWDLLRMNVEVTA